MAAVFELRTRPATVVLAGGLSLLSTSILESQNTPAASAGGPAQILTAADVAAVINVAASALGNRTLAVAVVDRTGAIVGVYTRPGAGETAPDVAVSLARTGAMFANDQAPLSSRTVRFISGIHFPPGVRNTANAALYGVENINRGCRVDDTGRRHLQRAVPAAEVDRRHVRRRAPGRLPLPASRPTRAAARAADRCSTTTASRSRRSASRPARPTCSTRGRTSPSPVPGQSRAASRSIAAARSSAASASPACAATLAEYAATLAAAGAGRGLDFSEPLGTPGAVFIDGLRLPFFGTCTNIPCIRNALQIASARVRDRAAVSDGTLRRPAARRPAGAGGLPRRPAREHGRGRALEPDEVRRIVEQSVAVALPHARDDPAADQSGRRA